MSKMDKEDEFGARMKSYEKVETSRKLDVHLPIYARIDGRAFSTFTRGMPKPFSFDMISAMVETTRYLVEKTDAKIGYTQSDEISLVWLIEGENSDILFSGKIQKTVSVLASMAAGKFGSVCPYGYDHRIPHFDARIFNLPSKSEATNTILWRAMDAKKNAISVVAQSLFSAKELFEKRQSDLLQMLKDKNITFEDYPEAFKRGSFVRRVSFMKDLVERHIINVIPMPPFNLVSNREDVIFNGVDPIIKAG